MDAFKEGFITKNARELEQHLSAAAGNFATWAIEVQSSLAAIRHNTRGLLWWTSIAAAVIISLFLMKALNSLRRVLDEINQHQVNFRQLWEADRAYEDQLRNEEQHRKAAELDRLLRAITAATAGRGHGAGTAADDPAAAAAAAAADDTDARLQQMDEDIQRLEADAPADPEEYRQWMQQGTAEIRARYADLLPPPGE
ncbi:hypothetical protein SLS62_008174 [Diatrype stigma]|uniref:Uncharacterized protein n=1 Tax=Diatrype stigma TaxID=117547 RepID=A0AAN9UKR4_9PEZI